MDLIIIASAGFLMIVGGLLALFFAWRSLNSDELSARIQAYIVEDVSAQERWSPALDMRDRELKGSVIRRIFVPGLRRISQLFGRLTPGNVLTQLEHQLAVANNPMGLRAREFFGLRIVFLLLGIGLTYVLMVRFGSNRLYWLIGVITLLIFAYLPKLFLLRLIQRRQNDVRKGLPDALDMLSVCATAGLGFDQAMQRVSEHWKTAVSQELDRVVSEMEVGVSRQNALRNMANRLDITELSSFVSLLIQSDQLGMSVADTLHSQAEQMRVERRFRAQEAIRKVPIKMLFPMTFLILPAIFAIILGPAVPAMRDFFQNF